MVCESESFSKVCVIHQRYIGSGSRKYDGSCCVGCLWWGSDEPVSKRMVAVEAPLAPTAVVESEGESLT